jgi:hypothetical protein
MMAQKPKKAEPKKECPSCGLGVTPESSICEFCGWDFEEEDEWILQIEKLERDLMLEKQKFEPGTVNHMIETTLRTPVLERVQSSVPAEEEAITLEEREEEVRTVPERREKVPPAKPAPAEPTPYTEPSMKVRSVKTPPVREEKPSRPAPVPARPAAGVPIRKAKAPPVQAAPSVPQRKVRSLASPPPANQEEQAPTRKLRSVRKVKQ